MSSATEIVLTFPSVGGATDIHYYVGVQLFQTLNSTELLPHHRTVSRCLQCAERQREHDVFMSMYPSEC